MSVSRFKLNGARVRPSVSQSLTDPARTRVPAGREGVEGIHRSLHRPHRRGRPTDPALATKGRNPPYLP